MSISSESSQRCVSAHRYLQHQRVNVWARTVGFVLTRHLKSWCRAIDLVDTAYERRISPEEIELAAKVPRRALEWRSTINTHLGPMGRSLELRFRKTRPIPDSWAGSLMIGGDELPDTMIALLHHLRFLHNLDVFENRYNIALPLREYLVKDSELTRMAQRLNDYLLHYNFSPEVQLTIETPSRRTNWSLYPGRLDLKNPSRCPL